MGFAFSAAHALTLAALAFTPQVLQTVPQARQVAGLLQPLRAIVEIPTQIEAMIATPGVLVSADYYPIDMRFGPGLALDAVVVTDVESNSRLRGLRIQVSEDGRPNGRTEASFLDFDDVARLSHALGTMSSLVEKYQAQDSQRANDLSFWTAGGFRVATHQSGRVIRVIVTTGIVEPVGLPLTVPDLPSLKLAVDQALAILNTR